MRLTQQAQDVLNAAKKFAKKLGHNYVGTEHLLIALANSNNSLAGRVLANYGVLEETIIKLVRDFISTEDGNVACFHIQNLLVFSFSGLSPQSCCT